MGKYVEERRFTLYFRDLPSEQEIENLASCLVTVGDYSVHEIDRSIVPGGLSCIGLKVNISSTPGAREDFVRQLDRHLHSLAENNYIRFDLVVFPLDPPG